MLAADDPYRPLGDAEVEQAPKPKKAEKVPVLPVPEDAPPMSFRHPQYGPPVASWAYRNASGSLLGYDARFEWNEDGRARKDVLPISYCELGQGKRAWRAKALPSPRPLYGLDRLAVRPDVPVLIAEGAKCADAAAALLPGYAAVSWQGGGNAVGLSDWTVLCGRDVLIWPDRDSQRDIAGNEKPYEDQPGTITACTIVEKIRNSAASIAVLDLERWQCKDGWDAAEALAEGWSPEATALFIADRRKEIDCNVPGTQMPLGFEREIDGIYYVDQEQNRTRLCGPLKILARTRDVDGSSWGILLEWRDDDGRLHRWPMPKSLLAGDGSAIREYLLNHGLFVATEGRARGHLLRFLAGVDTPVRACAVTRVGWSGSAFALPAMTIGDTPEDRIIFQQPEAIPHKYYTAGTLAEWQQHVGRLAVGNSRLIFMMSAALVGPVLLPANEEGGGINVVGASSCGKTTGLKAAASIWGPPEFIRQWRATSNGLEGVAQQHSETFLCLDELSQVEPREAGAIAYMLGNGQGKSRATRTGAGRATSTWKLLFLSTGEVGLSEVVKEGKASRRPMAGQEVRVLDVPADAGKGLGLFEKLHGAASAEAFARQLSAAAATYYGTPAIEFLHQLTTIRAEVGDAIAGISARFVAQHVPAGADGQVQRAGRRFGLVAAAGELAIARLIFPWPENSAINAAAKMFEGWVARRGGVGSAEDRNILTAVRLFLELHGNARFEPWSPANDDDARLRVTHNRAGFWRSDCENDDAVSKRKFYILRTVFREEICQGFDLGQAVKVLKGIGALHTDSDGSATRKERLPGDQTTTRVYVIGPEIFDDAA